MEKMMENTTKNMIIDIYPLKVQFLKGESTGIEVEWHNSKNVSIEFELEIKLMLLDKEVYFTKKQALVQPGDSLTAIELPSFDSDFDGFGVDLFLYKNGIQVQEKSCSFDVVSSWRVSTRYGFLSDFYNEDTGDKMDVLCMRKLHLNLVQFYDWMYRCDCLVPLEDEYTDLMGRKLSRSAVEKKIRLCHENGMRAIAYGAVYAGSKGFYDEHPDWALYDSSGKVLNLIDRFFIMDITQHCPWHNHIIEQYKDTVTRLDFDGVHMDTYGFPKTAISSFGGNNYIVRLDKHFPALIHDSRISLEETGKDICLIFNSVGNWPVEVIAGSETDVVYIEVWHPYDRYHHIQQIIQQAKRFSGGKPIVLAAYLRPFMCEDGETEEKAENAFLALTSIIAANGAYHLILGEDKGILTRPYYVDYSKMKEAFFRIVRNYYDFIIRYVKVLFGESLRDVSMTHTGGDNLEYLFENFQYSTWGEADKVWVTIKEDERYKIVSFINLKGFADDFWNRGKHTPARLENLKISVQLEQDVKSVFLASPDRNMGRPQKPEYEVVDGIRGRRLEALVPVLERWSLLVVELDD